jgi:hypothetical protein
MLSMTDMDAPPNEALKLSLATPEDVKAASEKAVNFWVGAMSPLWVPFWAASTVGVSVWALAQGLKRTGMSAEIDPDAPLATKWPGFDLPFATPWSKGWGAAAVELDETIEYVKETVAEPMQLAIEAEQKIEEALFPVAETAKASVETVAEAVSPEPVASPIPTVEIPAEPVVKKTAKKVADTPLIDPVTETPVIPSVTEATAEITPPEALMPAPRKSSIPPLAPIPRRPEPKASKPKKR